MATFTVVVASSALTRARVQTTIASAAAVGGATQIVVVDLDGTYAGDGGSAAAGVRTLSDLASVADLRPLVLAAYATLADSDLALGAAAIAALADVNSDVVIILAAGVIVTGPLQRLADRAAGGGVLLPRTDADYLARELATTPRLREEARHLRQVPPADRPAMGLNEAVLALGSMDVRRALAQFASSWRTRPHALELVASLGFVDIVADPAYCVTARRRLPGLTHHQGLLSTADGVVTTVDASGYDPRRPWLLDPGAPHSPSLSLADHPALRDLLVKAAHGWGPRQPERFLDPHLRAEARRADLAGEDPPDLVTGGEAVTQWAGQILPRGHRQGVARYLAGVRALRPDLLAAFPDVPGSDAQRLAAWAASAGVREGVADPDLLRAAVMATQASLAAHNADLLDGARTPGVNLVGYLSGGLGLGESARLVQSALDSAGESTTAFDVSHRISSNQDAGDHARVGALRDVTLVCVNSPDMGRVLTGLSDVAHGTYRIGMWYWEFAEFPATQLAGFEHVDEVWVATDFIRDAVAAASPGVPVVTVTPPLPQRPRGAPPPLPERFGIDPARPWFLFSFDHFSRMARKNPLGLIEAYVRAFPRASDRGPQLVIKTMNSEASPVDAERLRLACAARPDLILIEEYLPHSERHVLVAHCTAYVSLHRAEGLGLTIAEAMAWGRPVVTTAYGGPTHFANSENSYQVDWVPDRVHEADGPYSVGLPWASPDLDHAALILRAIATNPHAARRLGRRGARDIRQRHSPGVAGQAMRARLQAIRAAAVKEIDP